MQCLLMLWHTNSSIQWLSLFTSAVLLCVRRSCIATQCEGGHTLLSWGPMTFGCKTVFLPYSREINTAGLFIRSFGDQPKMQFGVTEHTNHSKIIYLIGQGSCELLVLIAVAVLTEAHWAYSCMNVWGSAKQNDHWSRVVVLKLCRTFQTTVRGICEIKLHPHIRWWWQRNYHLLHTSTSIKALATFSNPHNYSGILTLRNHSTQLEVYCGQEHVSMMLVWCHPRARSGRV